MSESDPRGTAIAFEPGCQCGLGTRAVPGDARPLSGASGVDRGFTGSDVPYRRGRAQKAKRGTAYSMKEDPRTVKTPLVSLLSCLCLRWRLGVIKYKTLS